MVQETSRHNVMLKVSRKQLMNSKRFLSQIMVKCQAILKRCRPYLPNIVLKISATRKTSRDYCRWPGVASRLTDRTMDSSLRCLYLSANTSWPASSGHFQTRKRQSLKHHFNWSVVVPVLCKIKSGRPSWQQVRPVAASSCCKVSTLYLTTASSMECLWWTRLKARMLRLSWAFRRTLMTAMFNIRCMERQSKWVVCICSTICMLSRQISLSVTAGLIS